MISFKQYITEIFDSSYPVEYGANNPQHAFFTFTDSEANKFMVDIHRAKIIGKEYLEVSFGTSTASSVKPSMQPTNTSKNALKVYSTIGKELRNYIKSNPVDIITFAAASTRTYSIYDNLAKKIARELNGRIEKPRMREGTWEIHL